MTEYWTVGLSFYIVIMAITIIPSMKTIYKIITSKEEPTRIISDRGFFNWMAFFFFCVSNFIMAIRITYLLLAHF